MAMTERVLPFPRISDKGDGTVSFTLGKIAWSESDDDTLLDIGTQEQAIKLYARMWCIENGYETWADLLADSAGLIQYHARMQPMRIAE